MVHDETDIIWNNPSKKGLDLRAPSCYQRYGLWERSHGRNCAMWGAEGETPIKRGKLSGKRTVIHFILWREPTIGPPKGKARSLRARGNLSGKRTGELWDNPKVPFSTMATRPDVWKSAIQRSK